MTNARELVPAEGTPRGNRAVRSSSALRILFIAAQPVDQAWLSLDREAREIEHRVRRAPVTTAVELRTCWAVTPEDLLDGLLSERPTIVHFCGHGSLPGVVLQDRMGRSSPVPHEALLQLFSTLKDNIRLIVLNACYTEQLARRLAKVIECVVGTRTTLNDQAARAFAGGLYQALSFGRSVRTAFELGLFGFKMMDSNQSRVPTLHVCDGVDPDQTYLC